MFERTHVFDPWRRNLFYLLFLYYYIQNVLVKNFLIARCGHIFCHICGCVCFFAALTSSTRSEYYIHMVLINLEDLGQTSIKVAQRERRATAVWVWGLNPAGWSVLRTQNFVTISMTLLFDWQCIPWMSLCRIFIQVVRNLLFHRICSTMLVCLC